MTSNNDSSSSNDNNDGSLPRRFIYTDMDLARFKESSARKELLRFVGAMGKSCSRSTFRYDPNDPLRGLSPALASLHGSLRCMAETWLTEIPPDPTVRARFGNPAFRTWHERLTQRSSGIVDSILACRDEFGTNDGNDGGCGYDTAVLQQASDRGYRAAKDTETTPAASGGDNTTQSTPSDTVREMQAYLHDSFGHPVRLDYGTGHESSFQIFLLSLLKLQCFGNDPSQPPSMDRLKAACIGIFSQYLQVTRGIQTDYMLEPAGSHGVWGLDDYYCLSFYYGACQLSSLQGDYTPDSIHSCTETEGQQYLYFGCILYIKSLKKDVPFFESSPMLNDISNLPTWSKVAGGLLKLYEGEVLNKRPVVQHFVFGRLFAANWTPSVSHPTAAPQELFRR